MKKLEEAVIEARREIGDGSWKVGNRNRDRYYGITSACALLLCALSLAFSIALARYVATLESLLNEQRERVNSLAEGYASVVDDPTWLRKRVRHLESASGKRQVPSDDYGYPLLNDQGDRLKNRVPRSIPTEAAENNDDLAAKINGISGIQFIGGLPESDVPKDGILGPWFPEGKSYKELDSYGVRLRDQGRRIEILKAGTYFVYAQVYYYTTSGPNSFSLNVITKKNEDTVPIAVCTKDSGSSLEGESSCHTSGLKYLNVGDAVFIRQREKFRRVLFRSGHTYVGLILLD